MQRLISWARSLPLKPLLLISAVALWVLDILSALYFASYWEVSQLPQKMLTVVLMSRQIPMDQFDPLAFEQVLLLVNSTAGVMLLTLLLVNTVFYFYLYWQKRWSWQYVLTYSTTAALFALITAFEGVKVGLLLVISNALSIPAYLMVAGLLWARKDECAHKGFHLKP